MTRRRDRFHGVISGLGSTSGTRVVVGHWRASPYGAFSDAMVELPDGHRVLVAASSDVARFVAATYEFEEIRVEPLEVRVDGDRWRLRSSSLQLDWTVGRRTALGWLLRCIPRSIAQAPWWCSLTDVVARVVLTGVRTRGSAGNGRREWYGATDNRRVLAVTGAFDGRDLGALAPIDPPPAFGFSSTPRDPSSTEVVSTVEAGA
ncbi:hypothetical protein [Nocardioides psychrotolerans]|uniref:hypothetical protein n=1 Tax=Nocardioides psychrotolerans TaxID=1005945 RepID=UPI003137FD88